MARLEPDGETTTTTTTAAAATAATPSTQMTSHDMSSSDSRSDISAGSSDSASASASWSNGSSSRFRSRSPSQDVDLSSSSFPPFSSPRSLQVQRTKNRSSSPSIKNIDAAMATQHATTPGTTTTPSPVGNSSSSNSHTGGNTLSKRSIAATTTPRRLLERASISTPSPLTSPGLNNLWRPSNHKIPTPRRVLYTTTTTTIHSPISSSNSSKQRSSSLSPKRSYSCLSRRRVQVSILGTLIAASCLTYVYLVCSFMVDPQLHQHQHQQQTTTQFQEQLHLPPQPAIIPPDSRTRGGQTRIRRAASTTILENAKDKMTLQQPPTVQTQTQTRAQAQAQDQIVILQPTTTIMMTTPRVVILTEHDNLRHVSRVSSFYNRIHNQRNFTNELSAMDDDEKRVVSSSGSGSVSVSVAGASMNATNTSKDDEDKGDGYHPKDEKDKVLGEDSGTSTDSDSDKTCHYLDTWQTQVPVNCNVIHEIDLLPSSQRQQQQSSTENNNGHQKSQHLQLLGVGWFRAAWKLETTLESAVLKTLRFEREFLEEYYELHRRDAVAMERLTFSPFVMNVYGYCGQSAINELAGFHSSNDANANTDAANSITSLEQLDRRMRGKDSDGVMLLKLRLALSVAVGLSHVHYGPGMPWEEEEGGEDSNTTSKPRLRLADMAHYDINPRNIAIVDGGKPKLNDFNIAEFLQYNDKNETCGFRSRLHEPWWRAPEEMDMSSSKFVDEKVDVYALGNVMFHILTTHSPRGKMKKERMEGVRDLVRQGDHRPTLDEPFKSSKHFVVKAFRKAMDLCFRSAKNRGTSSQVAAVLYDALKQQQEADAVAAAAAAKKK